LIQETDAEDFALGRKNTMAINDGTAILAATIAQRHYIDGESKSAIADDLGISRFKAARLLDLSVREGIIRFQIVTPDSFNPALSEALRKKYGLRRSVVVNVSQDQLTPGTLRQRLGSAAASVLSETVTEKDVLGIGWGRTLNAMAEELTELASCAVVQMAGMAGSVNENPLELMRKIGNAGGGQTYPLFVPLLLPDGTTAASLHHQPGVAAAFDLFESITVAAVAIGSWSPPDSQLFEAVPAQDRKSLIEKGVSAEVLATLIRDDGSIVTDLDSRTIALSLKQLRNIKELILVAGGPSKARAIKAVLAAGIGTTLVTDSVAASELLDLPHPS
jgi:DNA-binding transcriptional regulator LsrR (DeoR family)